MYFVKSEVIDSDVFGGELILMNLETREVLVLNEAGSILWAAIDLVKTREELINLLREAMPQMQSSQIETSLDGVLGKLLKGEFLRTSSQIAVGKVQPDP